MGTDSQLLEPLPRELLKEPPHELLLASQSHPPLKIPSGTSRLVLEAASGKEKEGELTVGFNYPEIIVIISCPSSVQRRCKQLVGQTWSTEESSYLRPCCYSDLATLSLFVAPKSEPHCFDFWTAVLAETPSL